MVVACALMLFSIRSFGAGLTLIHLNSPPGDWVGAGVERTMTPADGTFSATARTGNSRLGMAFYGGGRWWHLDFAGPDGKPLVPDNYEKASRAAFKAPNGNGLDVSGDARGCNRLSGRFTIHEIEIDASGNVLRFAADFVQSCELTMPPLHGEVRFNSNVPLFPPEPVAVAGADRIVDEQAIVALDGTASYDPDGAIVAYAWRQVAGTPIVLSSPASGAPSFTTPDVAAGGEVLAFELEVTDNTGNRDVDTVSIRVRDARDPRSLIAFKSQAGDYIGRGETFTVTEEDGTFEGSRTSGGGAAVRFHGDTWWDAGFDPAEGAAPLAIGTYRDAQRWPFQEPGHPGLSVSGDGRGCNTVSGRFEVLEAVFSGPDLVRLAIDFEQHCEGWKPALFGSVRFQSAVPIVPRKPSAYASAPARMLERQTLIVDGSASLDPQDSALSYRWSQLAGPPVAIDGATTATVSFAAPEVAPGGADLVLSLEVRSALGLTDSTTVTVHVVDDADPKSFMYLNSQPGAHVADGQKLWLYEWDTRISATARYGDLANGIGLRFDSPPHWFFADFAPIVGTGPLKPGRYRDAERAAFASPGHPGLDVAGDGAGCNALHGDFEVHEVEYGASNDVLVFAADFVQRCGTGALFGSIRFNSAIPIRPRPPSPYVLAVRRVREGATVTLDARRTADPQDRPIVTRWSQIAGPAVVIGDPAARLLTFVAPDVPAPGAELVFRLDATNTLGLSDSTTVRVQVVDGSAIRYVIRTDRRPGYPGSDERPTTYDEFDGTFSAYSSGLPPSQVLATFFSSSGASWWMSFAAPDNVPLAVGHYPNAQRDGDVTPGHPRMLVHGAAGATCDEVSGSFTVLEMESSSGALTKLAVDFVQFCDGSLEPLYGSLRYNSALPVTVVPFKQFRAPTVPRTGIATVSLDGGGADCRFENARLLPAPPGYGSPPAGPAPGVRFPHGLLALETSRCAVGAAVTVSIDFPASLPRNHAFWRYGPTADNAKPHWYVPAAQSGGSRVTFAIVDGGAGDDDRVANGRIVMLGGPGGAPMIAAAPPVEVPTLSDAMLALLGGLLLLAAARSAALRVSPSPRRATHCRRPRSY
jgi:hypothetical protein